MPFRNSTLEAVPPVVNWLSTLDSFMLMMLATALPWEYNQSKVDEGIEL